MTDESNELAVHRDTLRALYSKSNPASHHTRMALTLIWVTRSASAINPTRLPPQFNPTVSHILISYPLDKIWALSLFRSSLWDRRMRGIVGSGGEGGGSEQPSRLRRVLLVQGTRDEFTKDQVRLPVSVIKSK